jgi:N utilization substance protein B
VSDDIHSSRRGARETALGWLYEADLLGVASAEIVDSQLLEPDEYAAAVVRGVSAHIATLDEMIVDVAEDWDLARMPVIDRAILRMASFELAHRSDVPTGAILSEAVELATSYSTAESSTFINGVLAEISTRVRS